MLLQAQLRTLGAVGPKGTPLASPAAREPPAHRASGAQEAAACPAARAALHSGPALHLAHAWMSLAMRAMRAPLVLLLQRPQPSAWCLPARAR